MECMYWYDSVSIAPEDSLFCEVLHVLTKTLLHVLQYGFTLLPDEQREAADLWLVNTCTVKSPSQSAMDNVISAGRQLGKHLIVAGCVPQGETRP
jgi:tRNA A37 methylthiotransferase MiaB